MLSGIFGSIGFCIGAGLLAYRFFKDWFQPQKPQGLDEQVVHTVRDQLVAALEEDAPPLEHFSRNTELPHSRTVHQSPSPITQHEGVQEITHVTAGADTRTYSELYHEYTTAAQDYFFVGCETLQRRVDALAHVSPEIITQKYSLSERVKQTFSCY